MAHKLDRQMDFSGSQPPAKGIENKFDGTGNPDQGEITQMSPSLAPNMFPREGGSDTYTDIPGDGKVAG